MKTLEQDLNRLFGKPRKRAAKTHLVAVMPDGAEYPLRKRNLGVHIGGGIYAPTIKSAREHFEFEGAKIERRHVDD
ncbi:hypothetical protein P8631_11520 (plasmid) [Guyparkeria sp. 1SP6A2]|nr:hypothetical protein [Guyparkeria sp. 1SP6A2]